jgi:phosphoribosylglycinamide formyltransferase-1
MKIAIFASGTGSNALKIIDYLTNHLETDDKIKTPISFLVLSNKADAPILEKISSMNTSMDTSTNIETFVFNRKQFYEQTTVLDYLQAHDVQLIVLAGFLWLVPNYLVDNYPHKIINIHPALLPKFGGKGMFGIHVHEAVKQAKETETGITIHFVNKKYDEGEIILQKKCVVHTDDTAEMIAKKVLSLEHEWLPKVVEQLVKKL